MDQNEAHDEDKGQSDDSLYEKRKARLTPRQLWAYRKQQGEENPPELKVTPVHAEPEEPEVNEPEAETEIETEEERIEQQPEPETPPPVPEEQAQQESETSPEPEQEQDDLLDDLLDEPVEKKQPRMVDASRQPGTMRYPFATHGPVVDEEEEEEPEEPEAQQRETVEAGADNDNRRISSALILGILIIGAALFVGLAIAGQQHRIHALEKRIAELEEAVVYVDAESDFSAAQR